MFSDPGDVAVQGTEPDKVYPYTIFLPGSGIQRGSTFIGDGDPLSPEWPSVENAYRLEPEEAPGLPKIPAQPIGYAPSFSFFSLQFQFFFCCTQLLTKSEFLWVPEFLTVHKIP